MATPDYTAKDIARFWTKVAITANPDKCWEWRAKSKLKFGYGMFYHNKKQKTAHRTSWEIINGGIPDNLEILHKCDNPKCCNPHHLFLGTQAENVCDMAAKGRTNQKRGEESSSHKLTLSQVQDIRRRYAEGGITQQKLGIEFGVNKSTICNIISFILWNTESKSIKRHSKLPQIGENHPIGKLTNQDVINMRQRYAAGGVSYRSLGLEFGVNQTTTFNVVNHKTWKHI